ncbi:MAG: ABC transporter ATP-binding protein [Paracoccus sp. (in: a-proteobacteria)]|nr:ABC transporter ATP-binding protein [Paracoccus sp. (in: a-proteobacteria)]
MTAPLLCARDLVGGYRPGLPILHGAGVEVAAGEFVALIGPNGAGKSTLMKAIAGIVPVWSGEVQLAGRTVTNTQPHRLAEASLAFVPQTNNVFTTMTIDENLRLGAAALTRAQAAQALDRAYAAFPDLTRFRHAPARALSGGQRQMLAVARALLTAPKLLMLDEPSAGLSPLMVSDVFTRLKALVAEGVAILMVEQNVKAAFSVADRAYVLTEGRNRLDGTPERLSVMDEIIELYLGGGGRRH